VLLLFIRVILTHQTLQMKTIQLILIITIFNQNIMAKEIKTQITINASPEIVWNILMDFKSYPQWNPFIKLIEGEIIVGKKIKAHLQPPGAKGMVFKPTVLKVEQNKTFVWLGHLLMPGLFDGEHIFELMNNNDGSTTFIQREKFNGILVPLFKKMLDTNTMNGFNQMNLKLKELAESKTNIL